MKSKPGLVSIVIPMYNVYPYIKKTLESVVNQTYKNIEVIIVDDKSTDQSREIAEEFAAKYEFIRIFETPSGKKGPAVARNLGLKKARGEYVVFLDGDDYWDEYFLGVCVETLKEHPWADFCASASVDVISPTQKIIIPQRTSTPSLEDYLRRHVRLAQGMVLFRREFLLKNSIFYPTSFMGSEDALFIVRAIINGKAFVVNAPLFFHVRRSDSLTSSKVHLYLNQLKIAELINIDICKSEMSQKEKIRAVNALFSFHLPLFLILSLDRIKRLRGRKAAWKLFLSIYPYVLKFRPGFNYYSLLGIINLLDLFVPVKFIIYRLFGGNKNDTII